MCLGTWMGFAVAGLFLIAGMPTPLPITNTPLCIFLHGLLSTGGIWLIHTIQEAFERAFDKEK